MTNTVSRLLSDETLNRIVQIESAGKLKAKAPTSSALGPFQFLNGTWLETVRKHRPDLMKGRTQAQVLALRTDKVIGIELGARFTEDNAKALGSGFTDGDLYLAHFLGIGTARKFLRASPAASAETLAGPAAVKANRSILAGKTAGQVRRWAQQSMVNRWEKAGRPDWIAKYYAPAAPLALADADDERPVKIESDFAPAGDDDDQPPELNVQPVTATFNVDVKAVQQTLIRVGYHEVGGVDGVWGGMTAAGIAAFKNDRGLKGEPVIDKALKDELSKAVAEGWSRPIAPARANVTADTVAKDTPAAKQTLWQWIVAKWTAVIAFIGSLFSGISEKFEGISSYVAPVRDAFTDVPGWLWLFGIASAAALVWLSSRWATEAIVDDKRTGKLS